MIDDDLFDDKTMVDGDVNLHKLVEAKPQPSLVVLTGLDAGRIHRLERSRTIVGRTAASGLLLADENISRQHAEVILEAGHPPRIRDLNSTNGTRVNGDLLPPSPRALQDGDQIQLATSVILKFTWQHPLEEELQRNLYHNAVRDGLTGIYNKRFMLERFEQEFAYATRHMRPLSVLVFDLDHFKVLNDTFGHAVGDLVLKGISGLVQQRIRLEDVLGRFGGEEFLLLMRETEARRGMMIAERIRVGIEEMVIYNESQPVRVTASMGVATSVEPGIEESMDLFILADRRLYRAKESGRNKVLGPAHIR